MALIEIDGLPIKHGEHVLFFHWSKPLVSGWWFGTMEFLIFPNSWDDDPI